MPLVPQRCHPHALISPTTRHADRMSFPETDLALLPALQGQPIERVQRDGVELHIQWAGLEQWAYPIDRPAYRFMVSDVDTIYAEFKESGLIGAETSQHSPWAAPADTPWATREFHLRDPGQNSLQFYRPL